MNTERLYWPSVRTEIMGIANQNGNRMAQGTGSNGGPSADGQTIKVKEKRVG